METQIAHRNAHQVSAADLVFHADLGHQRHPIPHAHKTLDGLQRGQFHVHVQGSFVAVEGFDHFIAVGRRHDVGYERLRAQLPDADFARSGQRMARRNHQDQLVQIHHRRLQLRLLRIVRKHSEFHVMLEHIVGNVAAQRTPHRDLNRGIQAAKLAQHRQQVERGKFIGGDRQLPLLQFAHFHQRRLRVLPQVEQLLGVFLQNPSRIGEYALARRTVEQRLADLQFKFADGLADRRLRTKQLFRRPRKPPLASHREEDFELRKVHRDRPQASAISY